MKITRSRGSQELTGFSQGLYVLVRMKAGEPMACPPGSFENLIGPDACRFLRDKVPAAFGGTPGGF